MIRIEHKGDHEPPYSNWQQWGDMLFAITRPDSVMEAIYACRSNHPGHAIRIYAEKVWPESRLIYRIHDTPSPGHKQQQSESGGETLQATAANQSWGDSSAARVSWKR
jgi:ribulose bisphosphate carboxylase small subunit